MAIALTVRFLPPAGGKAATISANGRAYTAAANGVVDVLSADAIILGANNWIRVGGSGTTANRPTTNIHKSQVYFDTTLNAVIFSDGVLWHNPVTGAVV